MNKIEKTLKVYRVGENFGLHSFCHLRIVWLEIRSFVQTLQLVRLIHSLVIRLLRAHSSSHKRAPLYATGFLHSNVI